MEQRKKVPVALFNSKALFNPYQYLPFEKVLRWDEECGQYVADKGNLLITDEVGVGKTFEIGIILRELLNSNPDLSVLIFCPVKLCENWERELAENFYINAMNYNRWKQFDQISVIPYSYFGRKSLDKLDESTQSRKDELRSEREMQKKPDGTGGTGGNGVNENLLPEEVSEYDVLILDEAHYIRNKGKLWDNIASVIAAGEGENDKKLKIFMTGTPVFNSEEDYDNITELLSYQGQEFQVTKTLQSEANCYDKLLQIRIYGGGIEPSEDEKNIIDEIYSEIQKEDDEGNEKWVSKYGHLTGFLKRISSSSIYSLKKFVEKRVNGADTLGDADGDAELDYEEYWEEEEYEDSGAESGDLRELLVELGKWKEDSDSKFTALTKLLGELNKENEEKKEEKKFKAVIFSWSITTCNYLKENLESQYHVYTILGQTNAKKVSEEKAKFEKASEPAILICSDAAKEGHNLQFCQYLIHYDLPYTPAAIGQRNGRIYRKGQEGTPEAYYMLLNKGYDQRLFGEIIVGKCEVVKKLEEEGKLSWMNILPEDAGKYVQDAMAEYIKDKIKEYTKEDTKDKAQEEGRNPVLQAGMRYLKKEFYKTIVDKEGKPVKDEQGKLVKEWVFEPARNLYKSFKDGKVGDDEVVGNICGLYNEDFRVKGEDLKKMYEEKYNEEEEKFVSRYFGEDGDAATGTTGEDASKNLHAGFIAACEAYVGAVDSKYCHDVINAETSVSIKEYKEQFTPLKEWEVQSDERGNNQ